MIEAIMRWFVVPVLLVSGGVGVMLALGGRQQDTRDTGEMETVPQVDTVPIRPHEGGLDIRIDGVVAPFREIEVAAEVAGRVWRKAESCKAGRFVRQGTVLVEIDPEDYQLELERYQAQLDAARQDLDENAIDAENLRDLIALANQDLVLRQRERDRRQSLRSNAVSQSELDMAEQGVVAAKNALQTLNNQLRTNEARRKGLMISQKQASILLRKAERDLGRTKIEAPVDGVIVRDAAEEDAYVQKGQTVFVLEDTAAIEVECNLKMEELYWLWRQESAVAGEDSQEPVSRAYRIPSAPVTVIYRFAGNPHREYAWKGNLTRYEGVGVDDRTRTVPCRVVVDDPRDVSVVTTGSRAGRTMAGPPALVRGMYVTVVIHAQPNVAFVRVPEEAVQPGKIVWRVRDARLERIGPLDLVQYCEEHGDAGQPAAYWLTPAEESGLGVGDALLVTPLSGMRDGMEVRR